MRTIVLTYLGFQLNTALSTCKYDHISIESIKSQIRTNSIFDYLVEHIADLQLSLLTEDEKTELLEEWGDFVDCIEEKRKMGIENRGLCLLLAYIFQGIQDRHMDI